MVPLWVAQLGFNVSLGRKLRLTAACAFTQSDQSLMVPLWVAQLGFNVSLGRKLRLTAACAFTQSDQSLMLSLWVAQSPTFLYAENLASQQPVHSPSLIRVFDDPSMGSPESNVSLGRKLRLTAACAFTQSDQSL